MCCPSTPTFQRKVVCQLQLARAPKHWNCHWNNKGGSTVPAPPGHVRDHLLPDPYLRDRVGPLASHCPLCLVSWAVPFYSSAQYLMYSVGLGCWKTVVSSESSKNSLLYFMKYTARILLTNPGESPPSDSIWKGSDTVQESSSLFPIKSLLHSQIHPLFLLTDLSFS